MKGMKKYIWILVVGLLAGCTGSDFTIEAQLDGLTEQTAIIAYVGDQGAVTERVTVQQGNVLKYSGHSTEYTLVSIWDLQSQLIAQLVVHDGDQMTVKSDGLQLPTLEVSGNKITEQWMKFRQKHQQAYDSNDTASINRLIEQQIKSHPDQLLSTVLLVADYSRLDGSKQMTQLLQAIQAEVRPPRLVNTLEYLSQMHKKAPNIIHSLTLYRYGKGFDNLSTGGKQTVMLFWSRSDDARGECIKTMRELANGQPQTFALADILVDTDTTQWSRTLKGDSTTWSHWWAPGGIMDPALEGIVIDRTPLFIVTDSLGQVIQKSQQLLGI